MTTTPLRDRHLITGDIINELGGNLAVARRIGRGEETVKKIRSMPEQDGGTGREPTVRQVLDILALTASEPLNTTLRALARELITHFAEPAHHRVSTDDPVEELRYVQALLENRVRHMAATTNVFCPECGEKLIPRSFINGVPEFRCSGRLHGKDVG